MPFEPGNTNRPPLRRPHVKRRDVLRGGAAVAAGLGAVPLLSACSDGTTTPEQAGSYPLATKDDPVTLPINDDNPAIEDGLEPEKVDVLRVLNYSYYMNPKVKQNFKEQYGAEVQVTPYNNYDEMLNKLSASNAEYDLVFPGPTVLSRMVYGGLLQPLNRPTSLTSRMCGQSSRTPGTTRGLTTRSLTPCTPRELGTEPTESTSSTRATRCCGTRRVLTTARSASSTTRGSR